MSPTFFSEGFWGLRRRFRCSGFPLAVILAGGVPLCRHPMPLVVLPAAPGDAPIANRAALETVPDEMRPLPDPRRLSGLIDELQRGATPQGAAPVSPSFPRGAAGRFVG